MTLHTAKNAVVNAVAKPPNSARTRSPSQISEHLSGITNWCAQHKQLNSRCTVTGLKKSVTVRLDNDGT